MVCRTWYNHCVSIFYRWIDIAGHQTLRRLCAAAATHGRVRLLLGTTTEVNLELGPDTLQFDAREADFISNSGNLFPSLRKLTFSAESLPDVASSAWRSFKHVTVLTLRVSYIISVHDNHCHLRRVLCSLPKLRRVALESYGSIRHIAPSGPHPVAPASVSTHVVELPQLREVCINVSDAATLSSIVQSLSQSTQLNTINVLEVQVPGAQHALPLNHMFGQMGSSLAHFRQLPSLYDNCESPICFTGFMCAEGSCPSVD